MNRREFLQSASAAGFSSLLTGEISAQTPDDSSLSRVFTNPPEDAGLSVVYHWTGGLVTREGITADLEAMAASGIKVVNWFYFDGEGVTDGIAAVPTKTPEWWSLVELMIQEAKRLNLILAPHISSSWVPAGTAEITPETSQQCLIWKEITVQGGHQLDQFIPRPTLDEAGIHPNKSIDPAWRDYYRDIAILAFPVPSGWNETSRSRNAKVTTNLPIKDLSKISDPRNTEVVLITDQPGWIQFDFDTPFTLRSVTVEPGAKSTLPSFRIAHSLEIHSGADGISFEKIGSCEPMYNGWQTKVSALTHTLSETTARSFRAVYVPSQPLGYDEGMRKGTRETNGDFPHMIEPLNLASIVLSTTPTVHHLIGKNGSTWGRSRLISDRELPPSSCIPLTSIVDLTGIVAKDGNLSHWQPAAGEWRIIRFGYTSHFNQCGGGLHCDKLSATAAQIVFDGWFAKIQNRIPSASNIVKILNMDSWEARSQNWSPVFRDEFKRRRGYDLIKYLPAMTGIIIESASTTEAFLLDIRRTISECIADNFFGTLQRLAHQSGAILQTECIALSLTADGIEFYKNTDWTGGEFWVRVGNCWKPNDIADSVAGARLYGKKVIFAEAYTGGSWEDHPFALKAMGDHNFVQGINRLMLHVWREQYAPHRAPGVPGAGTPFNYLNTWWKPAQPWRDYLKRTQALLQEGHSCSDILYFTGENIPCRSLISQDLGFTFSTHPQVPKGYKHDTINRDALLRLANVRDGKIFIGELSYRLLVLRPDEPFLSARVCIKLLQLVKDGAAILGPKPLYSSSLEMGAAEEKIVASISDELWSGLDGLKTTENKCDKGHVFCGMPIIDALRKLDAEPDLLLTDIHDTRTGQPFPIDANAPNGTSAVAVGDARKGWGLEWLHRKGPGFDLFFISNQEFFPVSTVASFNISGRIPEIFFPDSGEISEAIAWKDNGRRTTLPLVFDPAGSLFIVFRHSSQKADPVIKITGDSATATSAFKLESRDHHLEGWSTSAGAWDVRLASGKKLSFSISRVPTAIKLDDWDVTFNDLDGTYKARLNSGAWTSNSDERIRTFSGTATYCKTFLYRDEVHADVQQVHLSLGDVRNIARVLLNGIDIGTVWKAPYFLDIGKALRSGINELVIEVTNTWINRLLADNRKPLKMRTTFPTGHGFSGWPSSPPPSGLLGPVQVTTAMLTRTSNV